MYGFACVIKFLKNNLAKLPLALPVFLRVFMLAFTGIMCGPKGMKRIHMVTNEKNSRETLTALQIAAFDHGS